MAAAVPRRRRWRPLEGALATASTISVASFLGLAAVLLAGSAGAWRWSLLLGADWSYREGVFGAAALLWGTTAVAGIALALALPIALGAAVCTSEWLPRSGRLAVKSLIELLAGVPSVVWGLLGVLLLRDWLFARLAPFEPLSGDTLLTAGVLLAAMILPTIATLADDALQAVPRRLREAGRALGLTRSEVLWSLVLPEARRGLVAAALLGLGRALGETVAVFLVVGRLDGQLPRSLAQLELVLDAGQTLTSKLAGSELFLSWNDPGHRAALMALGVLLLAGTSLVTLVGLSLTERGDRA